MLSGRSGIHNEVSGKYLVSMDTTSYRVAFLQLFTTAYAVADMKVSLCVCLCVLVLRNRAKRETRRKVKGMNGMPAKFVGRSQFAHFMPCLLANTQSITLGPLPYITFSGVSTSSLLLFHSSHCQCLLVLQPGMQGTLDVLYILYILYARFSVDSLRSHS